ncbi:MAG: hypothetical protein HY926_11800 [Elusimicrobia bacterium]|nr:hypothetical protein [Elusimicrobiota bacterium]
MEEGKPSPRALALSLVGLAFFLSWEALALRSHLRADTRPLSWEAAANIHAALDWRETAPAGLAALAPAAPVPAAAAANPLYFALLGRAGAAADPMGASLWLNWFYLALLCVAAFGLAWHFRPDETALLSVVVLVGSPALQELFRLPLADLSLAAWTAAAYWALVRSDEFRKWPGALAFAGLCVAGLLHGWNFVTYFLPALYVAIMALSRENSRAKVLAAAGLILAGVLPWYAGHLPFLLARLLQGPAISVTSLWQDWSILGYAGKLADGLGVPFFLCALLGLCFPQYRRHWHRGWILVAWFVCAYVVWALAPVPQLRYLVPCLAALAVAGLGAWPKALIWVLAVIQLFTMANFSTGWISQISIPLPAGRVLLFPSQPPSRQDWHLADILRQAQAGRDPQRPFADITIVANDARFNKANLELAARGLGIKDVRPVPPGRRLCEFSEFVLLKDGNLGPEAMVGKFLPAVAKTIKDPKSWFSSAYQEAARWPLPDNSTAVLYRQKRFAAPPVNPGRYQYQFYSADGLEASNLVLEVGGWDAGRNLFRQARVSAAELRVGGLRFAGLQAELEDVLFQPLYEKGSNTWGDVRFLKLGRLRVRSLRTDGPSLKLFLEGAVPGLRLSELALDREAQLSGWLGSVLFSARAAAVLESSPAALRFDLSEVKLGDNPVPGFLLAPFRTYRRPLSPVPETPFSIEIPGLTVTRGWLTVP